MKSQFRLLAKRKFLPLFLTQFLGAFNDNLYKNSIIILITYHLAGKSGHDLHILITLAAGIFILPFFLFSPLAGMLADKYEKSRLIRIIKLAEILFMALACAGFYLENVNILMAVLFFMGMQSAFFGPLKYSILPDHLNNRELVAGNGIVGAGTFISILLGTIAGGLLIMAEGGVMLISIMVLSIAVAGWLSSCFIPKAPAAAPKLRIKANFLKLIWETISYTLRHRQISLYVVSISWFWFVGAVFLAQFPAYGKVILGGNEELVTLMLALFSIGVGLGALLCHLILKGSISARYTPLSIIAMAVFIIDLYINSQGITVGENLIGVREFLAGPFRNTIILFDLLMIAISGGVYAIPLYALLQSKSAKSHRARVIAGNNVLNALFMVASALITMAIYAVGFSVNEVFLMVAIINLPVFFITRKIV